MSLPPRAFYTLFEAAFRLGCTVTDIAEWACKGHFSILVAIPPCMFGDRLMFDMIEVAPSDALRMFPRYGRWPEQLVIRRVRRPGEEEWITARPSDTAPSVRGCDLMITHEALTAFENQYGQTRRQSAASASKYDWDGSFAAVLLHIRDYGLPANQSELIGVVQDWFIANSAKGDAPDESTIRKKLNPIWQRMRAAA